MSFNLVDLVKDQVKGQLIGQMGSLLGNEGSKATGAVESMIPALLQGLTGSASSSDGAGKLFGAIQDQDDSMLDNMGALLGGGQASTVIDGGNTILSSLFGNGGLGKLAGALAGFSGLSKGGTSSLMGMLAPIILGVIKRKVMGGGLNAGGLASMLSDQNSNISAALPQGLGDQLNTSGFLSSIGGLDAAGAAVSSAAAGAANVAGNARDAASDAVSSVAGGARDAASGAVSSVADGARDAASGAADLAGEGAKKGGSMLRWLAPLAILGALAWAAFTFILPGAKDATTGLTDKVSEGAAAITDTAKDAAATATDAATGAAASATDAASGLTDGLNLDPTAVGDQVSGIFSSATDTLTGITDVESATAAVPALGELSTKVESVSGLLDKLPDAARGPISSIAGGGIEALQPLVDKVLDIPGVGAVVGPVVGPIMEMLQGFGG